MKSYLWVNEEDRKKVDELLKEAGIQFYDVPYLPDEIIENKVEYYFENYDMQLLKVHGEGYSHLNYEEFKENLKEAVMNEASKDDILMPSMNDIQNTMYFVLNEGFLED